MKFKIFTLGILTAFTSAFSASIDEIVAYKSGDSMSWYHELIRDAYDSKKQAQTLDMLLTAIKNPETSDEAFRLSCKILKMIVDDKSVSELLKFADSNIRSTSVFDVLISLDSPKIDDILIEILNNSKSEKTKIQAAYALGIRGNPVAIKALENLAKSDSKDLKNAAIISLGHIANPESLAALKSFSETQECDKFLLNNALCELREAFIKNKDFESAKSIFIEKDFRPALLSTFYLNGKDKGVYAMDSIILSDSKNAKNAATIANFGRTKANSAKLIKEFNSLEDGAKIAAIRSFALTKDKSFFNLIKNEISDTGNPVAVEAIFACGFIGDKSVVPSLIEFMDSSDKRTSDAAQYSLCTMPIKDVDSLLKSNYSKTKNPDVLDVLLTRGNVEYKGEMLKRFYDSNDKNSSKIAGITERHLGYVGLSDLWLGLPKNNELARKKALRLFIKIVSKEREIPLRKSLVSENLSLANFTDQELQIIETRLYEKKKKK